MSITFVASASDSDGASNSLAVSDPAGTADGDFYIAVCSILDDAGAGTWSTPAGWTKITEEHTATGGTLDLSIAAFYRFRGASPVGSTSFSTSATAASMIVAIAAYRGVDATTPLDVTYSSGSHYAHALNNETGGTAAAITTVTNGAMAVLFSGPNGTATSLGAPTGYTLDVNLNLNTNRAIAGASKTVATATTETPGAWTHVLPSSVDTNSITLALRPAAAAASYILDLQPLYYGANLLANKTAIEFVIESGHVLGAGTTEASGTAGTTNASGVFQVPGGYSSSTADDVTVALYWEEGSNPVVDRSLIVKTTLVEDV